MSDWQPIETAPRDGSRVLLYRTGFSESYAVCYFSNTWSEWIPVQGSAFSEPTHWMPLPEPPDE